MTSVVFADLEMASGEFPQGKDAFLDACKKRTTEIMDYNTTKEEGCLPCLASIMEREWNIILDTYFPEFQNASVRITIGSDGKSYIVNYNLF